MQYITVRITGPTHPYLDTQVAAAAMLLGNARSAQPRIASDRAHTDGADWTIIYRIIIYVGPQKTSTQKVVRACVRVCGVCGRYRMYSNILEKLAGPARAVVTRA